MATPFMSEIKIMSFNFAPKGWALCNGQFLPINQNQALFSLLGTMYGGDGRTNFALPDLRGRVPMHWGASHSVLGERGGQESHTVIIQELPAHIHPAQGTSTSTNTVAIPTGNVFGGANNVYTTADNLVALLPGSISNIGGSQPHENRQPYLTLSFCIALQGIFPSQN